VEGFEGLNGDSLSDPDASGMPFWTLFFFWTLINTGHGRKPASTFQASSSSGSLQRRGSPVLPSLGREVNGGVGADGKTWGGAGSPLFGKI
jgi:hypothetical protein